MQDERFKTGEKVTFPARYKWISHTGDASCTINHDPYVKELDENERFPGHKDCRQPSYWKLE